MKSSIYSLILVLAGAMLCQPVVAFGQNEKTSAQTSYPKLVKYTKPARKKNPNSVVFYKDAKGRRKKAKWRRTTDPSKVPQLIRPAS